MLRRYMMVLTAIVFLCPRVASAQTMDIAAIIMQLLNQYQDGLQGLEVTDSLGQVEEMKSLGGIAGKLGIDIGSFTKMAGGIKGAIKVGPFVPGEIGDKLDKPGAVMNHIQEKMVVSTDSSVGNFSQMQAEAKKAVDDAVHVATLELFGAAVASKKLAEDIAKAQDDIAKNATDAEDLRSNIQKLTSLDMQVMKQMANIQLLKSIEVQLDGAEALYSVTK